MNNLNQESPLLDYVYNSVDEDDWHDAIDIIQQKGVTNLRQTDTLFTASVALDHKKFEVRLKIHPDGKYIQWLECTCSKNRRYNQVCAHIAALIIMISQKKENVFKDLNKLIPFSQLKTRKRKTQDPYQASQPPEEKKASSSKVATVSHFLSQIETISFSSESGEFKLTLENDKSKKNEFFLGIDEGAQFLLSNKPIVNICADEKTKQLESMDTEFILCYLASNEPNGDILVRTALISEVTPTLEQKLKKSPIPPQVFSLSSPSDLEKKTGLESYFVFFVESVKKYFQSEYFILPGTGIFPLHSYPTNFEKNASAQMLFTGDKAIELIETEFSDLRKRAKLYLTGELSETAIIKAPLLGQINVQDEQAGWFFLDPIYEYENDIKISMTEILKFARNKKAKFFKKENKWYEIPENILEMDWEQTSDEKLMKVSNLNLFRLYANLGAFDKFVGSKKILSSLQKTLTLTKLDELPQLSDKTFKLRNYQEDGLKWLWWLQKNGFHGLLADEMGLGKTHQAMALLSALLFQKPDAQFLVICPTTVIDHWFDKISQYAASLKPFIYHGNKRFLLKHELGTKKHTLLTSYGVLLRDIHDLGKRQWDAVILDEAHFVKNAKTATHGAVAQLNANIRICLTGTPIENNLFELKNIFDFLLPGYLGSDSYFRKEFVTPIIQDKSKNTELYLQRLIHPFKLRRIKKEVLSDLPEKIEDIMHCSLSAEQAKLYHDIISLKASPLIDVLKDEGKGVPYLHVFAVLTMLKQVCDHPCLLTKEQDFAKHESGKFELAKELIYEALESDHKIVIFSQYLTMIKIFEEYFDEENIKFVSFTGATKNRGQVVKKFNEDNDCKIFLGSLLAGGIGIDLTAASVVIHYDRWWNASKENQASDRVHRIGQNKNVQILKLVTKGTLEEKIDRLIAAKQSLFDAFVNKDEDIFKNLSRTELIELMA